MKSPEGIPLRVNTPQEVHKQDTQTLEKEAAKAEREIHDAEKDILKYEDGIAHSNAVVDSLAERRLTVKDKKDQTEYDDISKHLDIELKHVDYLVRQKEARVADLMRLRDEKTTLERSAHYSQVTERRKLH